MSTLKVTNIQHGSATNVAMVLDTAGTVKAYSTISVGNVTPSSSGAGITFPATQSASSDANTLDDYEEGTWTPSLFDAETGGNAATMTTQDGQYTKVGNVVTLYCRIAWSSKGSMTAGNYIVIRGFPFTVKSNTGNYYYYGPVRVSNGSSLSAVAFNAPGNLTLGVAQKDANGTLLLVSDLSASGNFNFSVTYLT
jgi:hypothetical protein